MEFVDENDVHMNPDHQLSASGTIHRSPLNETVRLLRDFPPAHFTLQMKSFTSFLESGLNKYKSNVFEAGGYTWRLCLYPNGNNKTVKDHISLYLSIDHKDKKPALPLGWEVFAIFKFFVYDHLQNKYLTIQDSKGEPFRFHQTKTKWGFDKFMPVETLKDSSNGYLRKDCCILGAEVFVVKYNGCGECLSTVTNPANGTYTWKIGKFSALGAGQLDSEEFAIAGHKWKLLFYQGKRVFIFLQSEDAKNFSTGMKIYAVFMLRIRNQLDGAKNIEKNLEKWFLGPQTAVRGFIPTLSLEDLNCKSAGYIVDDTIILEVQISLVCVSKNL